MDVNKIKIDKFICGEEASEAQDALRKMLSEENIGVSYADMMRYRVSNQAAAECIDTYYVAHDGDVAYSRLWCGYGRHIDAIGNFGNFVTVEELRGQGLGKKMLEVWYNDLSKRSDLPLCFLCTGEKRAAKLYFPYGFQPIERDALWGPLYMPLGDSPKDFRELCEYYYHPSSLLIRRPATVEWRHEIDCLLKFCLMTLGGDYTIDGNTLESAILYRPQDAKLLFTESGRCVGWSLDGKIKVHPKYSNAEIIRLQ